MQGDRSRSVLLLEEPPIQPSVSKPRSPTGPRLLVQLLNAHSSVERRETLGSVVRGLGFERLIYGRMNLEGDDPVPRAFCVSHGDSRWIQRYFARGYQSVDPRLQQALGSVLPCCWDVKSLRRSVASGRDSESVCAFLDAMEESGVRSGIMLAIRGPRADQRSIVSLSSSGGDNSTTSDALIASVVMLAFCLHEFYSNYSQWPRDEATLTPILDAKQVRILQDLARGLTDREIAENLRLSKHGVDYHLRRLRKSFNARNRVELVQAAIRARSL